MASVSQYGSIKSGGGDDNDKNYEETADTDNHPGSLMFRRLSSPLVSFVSDPGPTNNYAKDFLLSARYTLRDTLTSSVFVFTGGANVSVRQQSGQATIANGVINLVKNIVGAGALALPSGVAAFGNAPSALIGAAVWLIVMGSMFAYYFLLLGRICRWTRTVSYAQGWEGTFGQSGSGIVALCVGAKAGMGNLECSMILADTFRDLLISVGWNVSRSSALWMITVLFLLPLCLLKNLSVLAPFSVMGMMAMVVTAIAIMIRYLDGSYGVNGAFLDDIQDDMKPSFGDVGVSGGWSPNALVFLCMISEAYIAHYNAPRFWMELKQRTVPRFSIVVGSSFGISALYYIFVTTFGFLTFGSNSAGFILDNYSTRDGLASLSRVCVGVSLILGYPLIFVGFRDAMLDVLMIPSELQTSQNLNLLTILLLGFVTGLATVLKDLGLVTAIGGGTLGTVVVFIVPSLMFGKAVQLLGDKSDSKLKAETWFVTFLMWVGVAIGVTGVWMTLTK